MLIGAVLQGDRTHSQKVQDVWDFGALALLVGVGLDGQGQGLGGPLGQHGGPFLGGVVSFIVEIFFCLFFRCHLVQPFVDAGMD